MLYVHEEVNTHCTIHENSLYTTNTYTALHTSPSLSRFDSVQQELDKSSAQNKVLQREMERLQSEVMRCKNFQLKAVKDCEKFKEERDSVFNEYRLIMSERDQVRERYFYFTRFSG